MSSNRRWCERRSAARRTPSGRQRGWRRRWGLDRDMLRDPPVSVYWRTKSQRTTETVRILEIGREVMHGTCNFWIKFNFKLLCFRKKKDIYSACLFRLQIVSNVAGLQPTDVKLVLGLPNLILDVDCAGLVRSCSQSALCWCQFVLLWQTDSVVQLLLLLLACLFRRFFCNRYILR